MQHGMRGELKLDELNRHLAGMSTLDTLVLGIEYGVSLGWHYT